MAMFTLNWCVWNFCIIPIFLIFQSSGDQLFNFGLKKDPCELECNCESWKSTNAPKEGNITFNDRYTVNCTGMKFGLFQGIEIPKPLPFNTTDLVVADYFLGTLSKNSFESINPFPLNPQLISLVLRNCHLKHISYETFNSNALQSLHHVDISSNTLEELHEDTFSFIHNLETVSVTYNCIQKVANHTFRNLYNVKLINISHNWLKELPSATIHDVPSLEVLDVSYNWFVTLPWEMISQISSLKVLILKGNIWNCSCEMSNILQLNRSLLIGTQAVCQYPENLRGTLLEDLTNDTFSYCLTTEQDVKITQIITSSAIILACLYWYIKIYHQLSETQSGSPTKVQSDMSPDTKTDSVCVGNIKYNIKDVLYRSRNVVIYKGRLDDGRQAAIKMRLRTEECRELKFHLHLLRQDRPHQNVIQYFNSVPKSDFMYLALELCDGNLMTAIMKPMDGFAIVEPKNFLSDLTSGVCYLHKNGIQHCDIKPQNILWKRIGDKIVPVISDFDLSYFRDEPSNNMFGTWGWSAPELCTLQQARKDAVDIFSLGCVFYFILTKEHPFGPISDPEECQRNINLTTEYKPSLNALYVHYTEHVASMAEELLSWMIASDSSDRIEACKIMGHPFLMSKDEMLRFLTRIGNLMDDKVDSGVLIFKKKLEENANMVFDTNWLGKLHPLAQKDLNGFEKKDDKICTLLGAVYKKIKHFDKPGDLELRNKIFSGSKHGVVEYFKRTFPRLVPYSYQVLTECGLNV